MAHSNIDERRIHVESIMHNGKIASEEIKHAATLFGCHQSAIRADIVYFNNYQKGLKETYHVSADKKKRIINRDGGLCYICGKSTSEPIVEHIVPASRGGTANPKNLAVACQSCNCKKRYTDAKIFWSVNLECTQNELETIQTLGTRERAEVLLAAIKKQTVPQGSDSLPQP